jgi:hypothetical protein
MVWDGLRSGTRLFSAVFVNGPAGNGLCGAAKASRQVSDIFNFGRAGLQLRFGVRQLAAAFPGRELARAASSGLPIPASKLA